MELPMRCVGRFAFGGVAITLCSVLLAVSPAASADLGPLPGEQLAEPAPLPSQWQFSRIRQRHIRTSDRRDHEVLVPAAALDAHIGTSSFFSIAAPLVSI